MVSSARASGSSHRFQRKKLTSLLRSLRCLSAEEDTSGSQRVRNCSTGSSFVDIGQNSRRSNRHDDLIDRGLWLCSVVGNHAALFDRRVDDYPIQAEFANQKEPQESVEFVTFQ